MMASQRDCKHFCEIVGKPRNKPEKVGDCATFSFCAFPRTIGSEPLNSPVSRPEVLQRGKSKTENHYMELCYRGKTWTFAKRLRENLLFSKNDNIAFSSSILPRTAQCIHILHTVFALLFFCTSAPSLCGVVANYLRHPSKSCICAVPPSFKVFALIHSGRADNTV